MTLLQRFDFSNKLIVSNADGTSHVVSNDEGIERLRIMGTREEADEVVDAINEYVNREQRWRDWED